MLVVERVEKGRSGGMDFFSFFFFSKVYVYR